MSLRSKIAGSFTVISVVVVVILLAVIYFTSKRYTHDEFYRRLEERAQLYAFIMLEKDEMSVESYNEILDRQNFRLENEIDFLLSVNRLDTINPNLGIDQSALARIEEDGVEKGVTKGEYWLALYYPDNEGEFVIISKARDVYGERKLAHLRLILTIIALVYAIGVYIVGQFYARITLRPLNRLIQEIHSFDFQHIDKRLSTNSNEEEVQNLVKAFNNQMDSVEMAIESQNNFISHASHELKNPLTAILGEVETNSEREISQSEYRESLSRIGQEAEKINQITLRLLKLAQTSFGNDILQSEFYIDEVLFAVIENWKDQNDKKRLILNLITEEVDHDTFKFTGNEELIEIALINVIDNALKFSEGKVEITFTLSNTTETPMIKVRDQGIGIPEEALGEIYKPFYRADNARIKPGFGIGLPLTKKIMDMHHFTLKVERDKPGTLVMLVFG
jgi:signal transduction histidine kinase